jgi:hypothetical protein
LPKNRRDFACATSVVFIAVETWLPSRCLAMGAWLFLHYCGFQAACQNIFFSTKGDLWQILRSIIWGLHKVEIIFNGTCVTNFYRTVKLLSAGQEVIEDNEQKMDAVQEKMKASQENM